MNSVERHMHFRSLTRHMSLKQMSEFFGYNESTICRWRNGDSKIPPMIDLVTIEQSEEFLKGYWL